MTVCSCALNVPRRSCHRVVLVVRSGTNRDELTDLVINDWQLDGLVVQNTLKPPFVWQPRIRSPVFTPRC